MLTFLYLGIRLWPVLRPCLGVVGAVRIFVLLFGLTPFVLTHYSELAMSGSSGDQTWVWTTNLTDYDLTVGAIILINAREWDCTSYYSYISRFEYQYGSLLFCIRNKILNELKYFGLYNTALSMSTGTVLTLVAPYYSNKVEWNLRLYTTDLCNTTSKVMKSSSRGGDCSGQ